MIYNIDTKPSNGHGPSPTTSTKTQQHRSSCSTNILACLLVLVGCISLTNLIIGHRVHYAHYTEQNTRRRKARIRHLSQSEELQGPMMKAYLTSILQGSQPFPPKKTFKFAPGSLLLTSAEVFQHCYVNMTTYGKHVPEFPSLLAAVSDEYQLIYRNIPKSASSTGRHVIEDFLEGADRRLKHDELLNLVHEEGYELVSFVREPLNRFYSSYDESFFRLGPWMGEGEIVANKPKVRKWYHSVKHRMDKYPYLYEGMRILDDFRKFYCPPEILATKRPLKCNDVPSIDDGTLTRRFEQFVRDYDGLDPFDVHLHLQVSNLVFGGTGEPLPISVLYNASNADAGWQEIAEERGVTIPDGEITHGRKITRRFNTDLVSDETKRKICKLLALDYCCLNLQLPEVCRSGEGKDDVNGVSCKMKETDGRVTVEDWR